MANNTNWLNISSQSGSSGQTILTLSANKNLSTNYKTAEITAYNPVYNVSAKTYVTLESYAPTLYTSPSLFGVPDSGGTYELTISANCAWVIAFPDLVTSYSTSAGTGNAVVTFRVPGTTANTTLVGNIVVTDESGQFSRVSKVEQYGSGVHIGVFPVELYFDSTGGSKTFSVTADCAYNVSMNNTDWAFVEPNSGYTGKTTFTVTVNGENTGNTDIVGSISIDAPGQTLPVIIYHKKQERRLVATYYVTSTTEPTKILQYNLTPFSKAEYPDGTEITLDTGYTFPSTGNQTVYYTLAGSKVEGFGLSTALTNVIIPKGVTEIADYAFSDCSGLTSVTIPNTVIEIGSYAFQYCHSLSSITIPSGVTSIGNYCFYGSSVSSITFTSLTPPTLESANALSCDTLSEIIVPCPAVNEYMTAYPQYAQYISCNETGTTLYFTTDTSNVKGVGEVRTITILNTNINENRTGLNLPGAFPQQGAYTVSGNVIYLTYPQNPSSSSTRSWTIGIVAQTKDGVSLSGSYRITQNANVTYEIPYTADTSTVAGSGETRTITIDASNLVASSITIGVEGATGITYSYDNGVIAIVFPKNNEGDKNITIAIEGETLNGDYAYASVNYAQETGIWLKYVVTYNVTSTTRDTIICRETTSFARIEFPEGTEIPVDNFYRFPSTGVQTVYFYSKTTSLANESFKELAQMTSVIVPEGVTYIGKFAFKAYLPKDKYTSLTAVTLPSTLKSIGAYAFENNMFLTGITIPSGVTIIPDYCFYDCSGLSQCVITGDITSIGSYAFDNCSSLSSITIPNTVTSLGNGCFEGCSSLSSVTIPSGVTTIPYGCFSGCSALNEIVLGNVTSFESKAFQYCHSLSSITIPNTVTSLGNGCFEGCSSLSSITIPNTVTSLGSGCFAGCSSLSSVTIPNTVTSLGGGCFRYCSSLSSVTLPDNINSLGDNCFDSCTAISSVTFPSSLQYIGAKAYEACTRITGMTFEGLVPPTINTENSLGSTANTFTIDVPCQSVNDYKSTFGTAYSPRITCLSMNITALTLNAPAYFVGGPYSATVSYEPVDALTNFEFSSDSPHIVSIDANGVIKPVGDGGVATICVKDNFSQLQDCKTITAYTSASSIILYYNPSDGNIPNSGKTGYVTVSNSYGFQPGTFGFEVSGDGLTYVQNDNRLDITFPPNKFSKRQIHKITVSGLSWDENVYTDSVWFYQEGRIFTGGTLAATYNVTSTTVPTKIIHHISAVGKAEYPQGTEITLDTGYTFPSTGLQTVYFTITGATVGGFEKCTDLVSLTLPDDIESIGEWAFDGCTSLSAVNISSASSLLFVYGGAFCNCSLTDFVFPKDFYQLGGAENPDGSIAQYNSPFWCCNITSLTSYATVEPIFDVGLRNVGFLPFGTLFYPCGSNYSTWLSEEKLGYFRWYGTCFEPGQPMPTPHIPAGQDLEVFVTYNITQTTGNTKILYDTRYYTSAVLVDGNISIPLDTGYTFPSTGLHTVKYTLPRDSCTIGGFYDIKQIDKIIMPTCVYRLDDMAFQQAEVKEMTIYAVKAPHFTQKATGASGNPTGTFKYLSAYGVFRHPAGSDYSLYFKPIEAQVDGYNLATICWTEETFTT